MRFGIILPTFGAGAAPQMIIDTALAAERLGFDSVWVTDHLALPKEDAVRMGHIFEAITTLSFLAARTKRVQLGISTLVLPQRNPVEVAKEIATLDALSDGRVIMTAAIGWSAGEYANLGQNFNNRARRMGEELKVLRLLWSGGETFSFQGKYYHFEQAVISPQPVQSGGPPLWLAGNSPPALKRALDFGDGWHPTALTANLVAERLSSVRSLIGTRPFTICNRLHIDFSAQPDPQVAHLYGTFDQIREQLQAHGSAGVNYVILDFQARTQTERIRSMKAFQKEIMPDWDQGI